MKRLTITLFVCLFALPAWAAPRMLDVTIFTAHGEVPLRLEVANTPQTREYGLMNRTNIGSADGMLFLFPTAGRYSFWMKNTLIPLDMLFIDHKQTIVSIIPEASPHSLTPRDPGQPVIAVIELDGGRAKREGVAVGDQVRYVLPEDMDVE